jgi:organic radical activating enzyme
MLLGEWPQNSCGYCRKIEENGGVSDRIRHLNTPHDVPQELLDNPYSLYASPTILEVYFNNACNLGCLYCYSVLSSTIEAEDKKFGYFKKAGVEIKPEETHYKELVSSFWEWFPTGFIKLKRFNVLGGEPFYQKELDKLLDMIEQYPNKDCILTIVTNLMVSTHRLEKYISRFEDLVKTKKLKRIDITCSIDCWGVEQEYVRWGLDIVQWENNFKLLMKHKWIYLSINQTITPLTIKSMPDLLIKLADWRKDRHIGHWFSTADPSPLYLKSEIFGKHEFENDANNILKLMPQDTEENINAYQYMQGIFKQILSSETQNIEQIQNLIIYLEEKDRRRNTDWTTTFPWLKKYVV